ncbi:MAG TPA: hypothetical protein VJK51_04490 [Candidatus Nanoarchaeia archaeon]|nr:hypothetical protein [Candidatus Nanoarchaeia archaeon]
MVSITLSVPEDLKEEMEKHPEMNWSEIARQAIKQRIMILKKMDALLSKSTLTEEDALRLGKDLKKRIAERHRQYEARN